MYFLFLDYFFFRVCCVLNVCIVFFFFDVFFCLFWWRYCILLSCTLLRFQCNLVCVIFLYECMYTGMVFVCGIIVFQCWRVGVLLMNQVGKCMYCEIFIWKVNMFFIFIFQFWRIKSICVKKNQRRLFGKLVFLFLIFSKLNIFWKEIFMDLRLYFIIVFV